MATFKATKNASTTSNNKNTFKATRNAGYDRNYVYNLQYSNKSALDIINEYNKKVQNGDWISAEDRSKYQSAVETFAQTGANLRGVSRYYGTNYTLDEEKGWWDTVSSLKQGYTGINDFYNQFADENQYKGWRDRENKRSEYRSVLTAPDYTGDYGEYYIENVGLWDKEGLANAERINNNRKKYMTSEDWAIATYYLDKQDYDTYRAYMNFMDEEFATREAGNEASKFDNSVMEWLYNGAVGFENFFRGLDNAVIGAFGADPRNPSHTQNVSAIMMNNNTGLWKDFNNATQTITQQIIPAITPGGKYLMGISAAGNAYAEVYDAYGPNAARIYGVLSGTSEVLLEKALGGIPGLGGGDGVFQKLAGKILPKVNSSAARIAIQWGGNVLDEALEEGLQTYLEPVFKHVVTLGKEKLSEVDWDQVFNDALYNAYMGGVSAGAFGAVSTIPKGVSINQRAQKAYGGDVNNIVADALNVNPKNKTAQMAQTRLDKDKSVSGLVLNEIVNSTDRAKVKSAIESRLTELGETGKVTKLAEALTKKVMGEDLSMIEKATIKDSDYGKRVLNELNPDNIISDQYSTAWSEGIGTRAVNPEVYNLRTPSTQTSTSTDTTTATQTASTQSKSGGVVTVKGSDGNVVEAKISGVEVNGDKATLTLTNNEKVSFDKVSFSSEDAKTVAEIAIDRVSQGVSTEVATAMINGYDGTISPSQYTIAFNKAYELGETNSPTSELREIVTPGISQQVAFTAYELGKNSVLQTQANSDIINTEQSSEVINENGEDIRLRNGSEWNGSANPDGQISTVEGSTGQVASRGRTGRIADSEATRLVNEGRKVRVADLGIPGGSKTQMVVRLDDVEETTSMKKARAKAEARGKTVRYFAGDNLHITDKSGNVIEVRGYIKGDYVYVRADHPYYTADQIMEHELGHDKVAKGEVDVNKVIERLEEIVGKDNVDAVAEAYIAAYTGSDLTVDEIWEECICDSLGDMNVFASDKVLAELMNLMMPNIKQAVAETTTPNKTRGSPEAEGKASRELKKKKGKIAKYLPESKVGQANMEYIRHQLYSLYSGISDGIADGIAIANGKTVFIVDSGKDNGKLDFGVRRKRTISADIGREQFIRSENDKSRQEGNISDELLERIEYAGGSNIGRNLRRELGTELQTDTRKSENKQSGISQTNGDNRGLGKASREIDTAYLDAVKSGDMETAQKMVDEAAKEAGYNYHLYHGTDADFTEFDLRKHGGKNGKGEGYGIYLASNKEISAPYGKNVIDSYTRFNRLAEGREKTLSYGEVRNLIKRSCELDAKQMVDDEGYDSVSEALKDTWVSNVVYTYGYSNMEQIYNDVANKLWEENNNDGDLINEMMALSGANYDYNNALKFYENVLTPTTGIDGFHYIWDNKDGSGVQNDIYLAFNSNQIKSADPVTYDDDGNVIPLSERFNSENNDIRYSRELEFTDYLDENATEDVSHEVKPISNRELLVNSLESTTQNEAEKEKLAEYKGRIEMLNAEEKKLEKLRKELDENTYVRSIKYHGEKFYAKEFESMVLKQAQKDGINKEKIAFRTIRDTDKNGKPLDTGKYVAYVRGKEYMVGQKEFVSTKTKQSRAKLTDEIRATENRINLHDKVLFELEATKPLQDVLSRERASAYRMAAEKGREALHRNVEGRYKTAERNRIRDIAHELDTLLNKGTKKKNVKIGQQDVISKVLDVTDMLFATDDELILNGIKTQVTSAEQSVIDKYKKLYAEYHDTDNAVTEHKEERKAIRHEMDEIKKQFADVLERERQRISNLKASSAFDALIEEYKKLASSDKTYIRDTFDTDTLQILEQLKEDVGDTTVSNMTLAQLQTIRKALTMMKKMVQNTNKLFKSAKNETIEVLGSKAQREIEKHGHKDKLNKLQKSYDSFDWNNLKPIYLLERTDSSVLQELGQAIFDAESDWATDMFEARAFWNKMEAKYNATKWNLEKSYTFTNATGQTYSLTLEQIMSVYAYSKRGKQAIDHLKTDGFVFDETTEVKGKGGLKYELNDKTAYKITEPNLIEIVNKLTPEQKSYVDDMQKYLSEVMGEKGNEVSRELYGIDLFGEENYFPIRSEGAYLERVRQQAKGETKIKNKGFTKETQKGARNAIVLSDFSKVWSEHVAEMSSYHTFTLPLEDFYRVYNYQTTSDENINKEGVIPALENAYGKAATKAIDDLLNDINGGARFDIREQFGKEMLRLYKVGKTMLSLSVVVQQPTSILRAQAMIDPKYFVGEKIGDTKRKELWNELKQYAPVAIIKEMGYFDVGMGRSSADWLTATDYQGWGKVKGFFTDSEYRAEVFSKPASKADELTWVTIWNAVKRETARNNPALNTSSETFLNMAGKRFEDIIRHTQVYDSTLSRSSYMRHKNVYAQMVTSFMAEPTTSINMREMAMRSKDKNRILRTTAAVYSATLLNALLVALPYAMRDDDEDETFLEKYITAFSTSFADNINPLTSLPFVKDIWSILQGYDVDRADMTLASDLINSFERFTMSCVNQEGWFDNLVSLIGDLSAFTGIPLDNIVRDVKSVINLAKTIEKDKERATTWNSLADALEKAFHDETPVWGWFPGENKGEKLYDALVAGDDKYVARFRSTYKTEDDYYSAVRKSLRDNDPRMTEAAQAYLDGNYTLYNKIRDEIVAEDIFNKTLVTDALKAEINYLKRKAEEVE
jgi:hypothetical protein